MKTESLAHVGCSQPCIHEASRALRNPWQPAERGAGGPLVGGARVIGHLARHAVHNKHEVAFVLRGGGLELLRMQCYAERMWHTQGDNI
jgi:hypothetical protein